MGGQCKGVRPWPFGRHTHAHTHRSLSLQSFFCGARCAALLRVPLRQEDPPLPSNPALSPATRRFPPSPFPSNDDATTASLLRAAYSLHSPVTFVCPSGPVVARRDGAVRRGLWRRREARAALLRPLPRLVFSKWSARADPSSADRTSRSWEPRQGRQPQQAARTPVSTSRLDQSQPHLVLPRGGGVVRQHGAHPGAARSGRKWVTL